MPEEDRIDAAILSAISPDNNWTKVAMVISRTVETLEGRLPQSDEECQRIGMRIEALVNSGVLISQGNVKKPRHSEVEAADK